jgi:hypothetical protein
MSQISKGETFTDVAPGKTVTSTRLNNHVDAATLLPGAITDQTTLADPVADGDYFLVGDVSDGSATGPKKVQAQNLLPESARNASKQYAAGTLSGGVYAVTLAPAATAYTAGMVVRFKADSSNSGAVDINVNALGAKNLFTRAGGELAANDILANQIVEAVYDGTSFYVMHVISAGEITATHLTEAAREGVHQYAADSGVANTYAVTLAPAATAYTAGMVVRFKAANANTGASTLNVNAVGAINLKKLGGAALLANDILANQMVIAVYDGTNFQIGGTRSPDYTNTAALPGSSAVAAFAHGLGFKPSRIEVTLMNNTAAAELGYAQNDEVDIAIVQAAGGNENAFAVCRDATNITVAQVNNANVEIIAKTGGTHAGITEANWVIKVRAWI